MLQYTKKGMKSILSHIGQLEKVGHSAMSVSRTMAQGSKLKKAAAPFVGTSGRVMSAMGRHPGRTLAGGLVVGGAMLTGPKPTSMRGMGMSNMTRQNTMYNRRMRSGQSSALSGLQPRSMGGYA